MSHLSGKYSVITGATSGIGKETAYRLAARGSHLVLVGRSVQKGERIARRLRRRSPRSDVVFVGADLSSPTDVRELAAAITRRQEHVDVLINNAGARNYDYRENVDGIESTFATNHLGHFLLTSLLGESLQRAPAARVITISSGLHEIASADEWCFGRANYDGGMAYAKSKLANLMFAYELARRVRDTRITSNAFNPGVVATNFERNNGLRRWIGFLVGHGLKRRLSSARSAADAVVFLAASDQMNGVTGKYFVGNREVDSSAASYDLEAARGLWELSTRLTGLRGHETSSFGRG
jgi:NAD(P)-dependent dehydrogenase (short-subunit alcohol dehydrogenase family)